MTTTTETYLSTQTSFTNETNTTTTNTNNEDQSSTLAANVTIDELVQSCCSEVLPSSSQMNSSSSASPTHLVRFVHSQSSLVSQIDEQQQQRPPSEQSTTNSLSSHDTPIKQQPPLINVTRLPSPFKPKTTIIESTNSMQNTTNLTNITANNISVNNYNVNIHTTNVQQQPTNILNNELGNKKCQFDEKQTTEIVSQILKNIKEVDEHQTNSTATTTNYNIHIDSFNFSSTNDQQNSTIIKKSRVKKEAKALTKIIVKDESLSPNFSRTKKPTKSNSNSHNHSQPMDFIPVPYGWQRRLLASDIVVYLSPTNAILDSFDAVRAYLESPTTCKCGLQCPLIVEKVFNFDPIIKSKSWEVTQVLEGTHCRQKSNILEMATLTNCIDSFCETEQKAGKRRKRTHAETTNGNVFVCASNSSNILQTNNESSSSSVVFINNNGQTTEGGQSMTWTPIQQTGVTPPSKRPRGRPRKTAVTPPVIAQLAVKPLQDSQPQQQQQSQSQPVPSSILSPPASVSSASQPNLVHRNSTSPSTHLRYINDNVLTPSSTTDTNVIARVPSLFEQVKPTTNESTFAVLSGVQNVLLSPNNDTNNNNNKRVRVESSSSSSSSSAIVSTTGKPVTLNVNALKPDFVRSPAVVQKPCPTTTATNPSNQIDVISLMGTTTNQTQLMVTKTTPKILVPNNWDDYSSIKTTTTNEQAINESTTQPLVIDFNDPSTTNFLLSALASGASSDSNAIVNHLFQKAQTQQKNHTSSPPPPPTLISTATIKKKPPILSSSLKNCTETTNLLPIATNSTLTNRQSVVLHVPNTNDYPNSQSQQIIFSNNNNEERKQQIFFINNKPYVIQQKLPADQSSQQRLILTPSISQSDESNVHTTSQTTRTIAPAQTNNNNNHQSTLDDGGNCLVVNGVVEPRTLSTLLKGLNPSSFSGVDNLIDTIHRFEHTTSTTIGQNDNLLLKTATTNKNSPAKKTNPDKPPPRRRVTKKAKQDEQQQVQVAMPPPPAPPQPIVVVDQQQQWQTDFNSFDFSTPWGSDTNLNSLLLNDDFDTAASFDDVNFGDFEPYMNGNSNNNNNHHHHPHSTDTTLPSLFVKPLPPDTLPSVDHLLP